MVAVTLLVDRPVAEVFDYFTDFRNENEWNVVAHDVVKVTDGATGVGSVFRGVYDRMGPMEYTIRDFRPSTFASVDGSARLFSWHSTFTFSEEPGGTRVVCTMEPRPKGPLRVLKPLVAGMVAKQMDRGLASLKSTLEAKSQA